MNPLSGIGKALILIGLITVVMGILLLVAPRIPWLGKLPGDIVVKRENFQFYLPITTCVIISLILSLLFYLFRR
jgi:uncharacterized membrane protein YkgB